MKKIPITALFDHLSEESAKSVMQRYPMKESVDDMSKQRMYQNVMKDIDRHTARHTGGKRVWRKTSIAAAALVAALAVAGSSVAAGQLYKHFTDYKPAYTQAQKDAVKKATFPIRKTVESDGVTITAVEGLCDGEKLFILANIEVDPSQLTIPEGHSFFTRLRLHMSGDYEDTQMYPSLYNQVLTKDGNTCTVLYMYDMVDIKDGQTLALAAWGLSTVSKDGTETTEAIVRDRKLGGFTFEARKSDFAKTFSAEKGVKLNDTDFAVTVGYVAPWSAQIRLSGAYQGPAITEASGEEAWAAQAERLNELAAQVTFKVVMKDGTVYEGMGVSSSPSSDGKTVDIDYYCAFNEYVDTADIDHVEINGAAMDVK
ncbi:MAG: DUF4179 domain-containing protein [Clostridia bacterium]|nr:DUF4179 domain-containing protein [Clostridia bacterium]